MDLSNLLRLSCPVELARPILDQIRTAARGKEPNRILVQRHFQILLDEGVLTMSKAIRILKGHVTDIHTRKELIRQTRIETVRMELVAETLVEVMQSLHITNGYEMEWIDFIQDIRRCTAKFSRRYRKYITVATDLEAANTALLISTNNATIGDLIFRAEHLQATMDLLVWF